jgi:hypothetical protein
MIQSMKNTASTVVFTLARSYLICIVKGQFGLFTSLRQRATHYYHWHNIWWVVIRYKVCKMCTHHTAQRLFDGVLCFQNVTHSCGTRLKIIFVYTHKKTRAFPAPTFEKLTYSQQHYIPKYYAEFHPNWAVNTNTLHWTNWDLPYLVSIRA